MLFLLGICSDTRGGALPDLRTPDLGGVLHAGSVYAGDSPEQFQQDPASWAESLRVPVLAVRGDQDARDPTGFFTERDVSGYVERLVRGLYIAGIGWASPKPADLPHESDLQHVCESLHRQASRTLTGSDELIILSHYAPQADDQLEQVPVGMYRCIADLARKLQPAAVVHGHMNHQSGPARRASFAGFETLVVNPGPTGGWLMIDDDQVHFDKMRDGK